MSSASPSGRRIFERYGQARQLAYKVDTIIHSEYCMFSAQLIGGDGHRSSIGQTAGLTCQYPLDLFISGPSIRSGTPSTFYSH
jgi:hypothetical protein